MEFNAAKHDFYDVNMKVDPFFISVYTQNYKSLEFKTLVTEFKNHYKVNPHSKQLFPPQTSFAASLQEQTQPSQDEKSTEQSNSHTNKASKGCNQEGNECSSPCGQHSSWSKCYYLNPAV